jgi:hypothetical protein
MEFCARARRRAIERCAARQAHGYDPHSQGAGFTAEPQRSRPIATRCMYANPQIGDAKQYFGRHCPRRHAPAAGEALQVLLNDG